MTTLDFCRQYSVQSRLLCGGPLDGVEIHILKAGDRWFGGVEDLHERWATVIPMGDYAAACKFYWRVDIELAQAIDDASEAAL